MEKQEKNYLAEEPVGRLMMKFSVPCIMSLLVSALYNIVDQIFIGRGVGYLGNGATNVVFPITIISLAAALLIGDGCAAYLSLCHGKKDVEGAHKSAGNAITVIVACALLMTLLFALLKEQILWGFGATENNVSYAREYFQYILIGLPFFMFGNALNSLIRADGSPQFAMLSTLLGCVINIILDPIAIFVLHWGMRGAALATVAGQIVTAALGLYYLYHTKTFRLRRESFRLSGRILKAVLPLGISSFLTQISIVVIMGVMNNTLVRYGALSKYGADIPLTVVGIVMKVFQIVISIVVGIAAGCQPIVGYNYGAGNYGRVRKIFSTMLAAEFVVGAVAMLLFECFPLQIISIFGSEEGLYNEFAILSFRIYLSTIVLCCLQKATSIFLQSLGKSLLSTGLSLLRDFVMSVPLVLMLPLKFGIYGPLYSAPVADIVSFIVVIVISVYLYRVLGGDDDMQKRKAEVDTGIAAKYS